MADEKYEAKSDFAPGHEVEEIPMRQTSLADINLNRNLDAK